MHWNGKTWSRQTKVPAVRGFLEAVAATRNTVWAVGYDELSGDGVILHETGGRWYVVPNGAPAGSFFDTVAVTGPKAAWAGGGGWDDPLYRWNGSVWKQYPLPLSNVEINRMAVISPEQIMAVGLPSGTDSVVSFLWNGSAWRAVPVPTPKYATLISVGAASDGRAWAVGSYFYNDTTDTRTIIMYWNGSAWHQVNSPNPAGGDELYQVSAASPRDAWAVGYTNSGTLILHWNGKNWS